MECKTLHKKLIFFLEGDLHEKENIQFEKHLAKCPGCSAFASELKKTLGIVEFEKSTEMNPFFFTRVKAKLETQKEIRHPFWKPVFVKVLQPAMFSVILLLGIYGGIKMGQPHQSQLADNISAEHEIIPYLNEMDSEPIEAFLME